MSSPRAKAASSRAGRPRGVIGVGVRIAYVSTVMGCVLLLGVRTLTSEDLGYHLAYGEAFLNSGRLVDHDARLYTLPARELAADLRPAAGPGCWYDKEGRYRFPNANWLSQVLMASVYRLGGVAGLSLLRLGLVGALLTCVTVTLHRLRVPWCVGLGAILLTALVAYPRFSLRPELFGYVVLAGQMALLGGILRDGASGAPSRGQAMGLVALQWLFVNLHSYFLLGLALTGAMLGGAVVSMVWDLRSRAATDERRETARRSVKSLAALFAAQGLVCFLNPWTWRLAVLPFQTLAYLRANRIGAGPGMHPWSTIKELAGSSLRMLGSGPLTMSYAASWVAAPVGLAGLVAAGVRKRWGVAMIVLGMMLVGAAANRNLAIAAIVVIPLAVGVCAEPARRWVLRWSAARRAWMARGVSVVWIALSLGVIAALVSHRFYYRQSQGARLGWGLSRTVLPLGVAEWLCEHPLEGRLWVGFTGSSTLYQFVEPKLSLPILTNTWAYPPAAMQNLRDAALSPNAFARAAREHGVSAAVAKLDEIPGMFGAWEQQGEWALVALEGQYALFLRREGPDADLARRHAWRRGELDLSAFMDQASRWDAVPAHGLHSAGAGFLAVGWRVEAIEVLRRAVELDPANRDIRRLLAAAGERR